LGSKFRSDNPLPSLAASLKDNRMLLALDNCAHVIEAAAALATGILRGASGVHILATSREPLRVEGERVYRLSPLVSPPTSVGLTAADALAFPAVQLFVERAAASVTILRKSWSCGANLKGRNARPIASVRAIASGSAKAKDQ
jgi:predicted ATPase